MSFGDIFWLLMWLLAWGIVIGLAVGGVILLREARGSGDAMFLGSSGIGSIACAVIGFLIVMAVATGEWDLSSTRLLPDGCYRVGHEFSGKTTHNTFEPIEGCR